MAITFDVERFEHVTATPETALLRVSGRWVSDQRERLSPPMLVVDDGRRTHRLPALPGPEDAAPLADPDGPRWRAAFSAPAELITNTRNVFALDAGRGAVADLPRPVEGRRERRAEPAPEPRGRPRRRPRTSPPPPPPRGAPRRTRGPRPSAARASGARRCARSRRC